MSRLSLTGRCVIVPESRELDLFSSMIARHGAEVIRCPLVKIRPLADFALLDQWIDRLAAGRFDLLVCYTGEGVMRIVERAEELGRRDELIAALARPLKLARGPKPVSALRKLGLTVEAVTAEPTTDGLIELLGTIDIGGRTVGVLLYPGAPEERLADAIRQRGGAFDPVLPYRYASDESDDEVAAAIERMADGSVDLIAFTSQLQVQRLVEVAERRNMRSRLEKAFASTAIAAVGPITARAVTDAGGKVAISPQTSFHMKPLVAQIARELGPASPDPCRITVRFYGRLADAMSREVALPIPPQGLSVGGIRAQLAQQPGGASLLEAEVKAAVGDEIVEDDRLVRPGDQVDFLAPLSGG